MLKYIKKTKEPSNFYSKHNKLTGLELELFKDVSATLLEGMDGCGGADDAVGGRFGFKSAARSAGSKSSCLKFLNGGGSGVGVILYICCCLLK